MIRKLSLELRWMFPILPLFLIALTLEFAWAAERSWILVYNDDNGFGVQMWPNPPKPEDYQKDYEEFLKEHPQGHRVSLKEDPSSYFLGFDSIARTFLPYMVIVLCGGGILAEKTSGTTSFVLSLPVRRSSWLWSRAAALLLLTFLTGLIACLAALGIARGLEIHGPLSWLITEPLRLTLLAAPWIGVSLFFQSVLSGRLDTLGETVVAVLLSTFLALSTYAFLAVSGFKILPESTFSNPWLWYMDLAANHMSQFSLISTMMVTYPMGVVGLLLAIRRFERMDF